MRQRYGVLIDGHATTLEEFETSDDDFHYFRKRRAEEGGRMNEVDIGRYRDRSLHSLGWARRFIDEGEHVLSAQLSSPAAFYRAEAALGHLGP